MGAIWFIVEPFKPSPIVELRNMDVSPWPNKVLNLLGTSPCYASKCLPLLLVVENALCVWQLSFSSAILDVHPILFLLSFMWGIKLHACSHSMSFGCQVLVQNNRSDLVFADYRRSLCAGHPLQGAVYNAI